ncbi:MAG: long-chain fatty acid--CoA ligase, partial [Rhodoferax sp.]|nr:long-chain fatty acid--CoA ligase [Rhodoferax sp.]
MQPSRDMLPLETLRLYPPHQGTLASLLQSRAAVAGDRECLVFQGRSFTYTEVLHEVGRTAGVLADRGVRAGDRVGVMSLNHPASVFVLLALARLGAVMVPVNPDYGVAEARYVLNHADVCGVVCSPAALPTVRAACTDFAAAPWLMLNAPAEGSDEPLPVLSQLAKARCGSLPTRAEDP